MIDIIRKGDSRDKLFNRTQLNFDDVNSVVEDVIKNIRKSGDKALFDYAIKFDRTTLTKENVAVSDEEIAMAYKEVSPDVLKSLRTSIQNVLAYHKTQLEKDSMSGDKNKNIGWMFKPVSRAGVYVPGGTAAYPSSVIMTVMPAIAAGVKEIYMTTPYRNNQINPLTLVAAKECGVTKIFKVGGSQAIAALAFGTESLPKVDVIVGPGNIYVTVAKKQVYGYVGIDMIAGPSEILIIADDSANPKYLACDLLSQCEHDKLSTGILLTTSEKLANDTAKEVEVELNKLQRREIAETALEVNSAIVIVDSIDEAIEISNKIAPEHLEICTVDCERLLPKITNAGAVFLGNYSPEPLGDYVAGPSHVLPTSGTAKYFSVLNTQTFLKRISVINYNYTGLLATKNDIINIAEREGLDAHANAIKVRFDK